MQPMIQTEFTAEQREAITRALDDPWLAGQISEIERVITGKATPLEIIGLIRQVYRVGFIKGVDTLIEKESWEVIERIILLNRLWTKGKTIQGEDGTCRR